jgi:hypothetical protein
MEEKLKKENDMQIQRIEKTTKKIFYIDLIKVLSALIIILCHFDVHSFYISKNAILISKLYYFKVYSGDIGVSMFIIISGLTLALSNQQNFSISKFYKKRFLAIFPSFWISWIFVALVFMMIGKTFHESQYWKFILTFLGIDGLFLHKMIGFYLIGEWYLGYILIMYIFFPLIYLKMKKNPIQIFIILFLLNIIFHMRYDNFFKIAENHNPLMRVFDFSFGILLTIFINNKPKIKKILLIIGFLYLILYKKMFMLFPYEYHMTFIGFSLFLVLEFLISIIRIEKVGIFVKIIRYMAKLSFLAFLVHHQIILLCYEKIHNLAFLNYNFKLLILLMVIVFSFLYAAMMFPLIKYLTNKLANIIGMNN